MNKEDIREFFINESIKDNYDTLEKLTDTELVNSEYMKEDEIDLRIEIATYLRLKRKFEVEWRL